MTTIPHVVEATHTTDVTLRLVFADGATKDVDLRPYIQRGGVFAPLADPDFFSRFFVDLNTVCWPNGADVAPERLYEIGTPVERAA